MNNEDTVIAEMTRLLKLSEPNENGVAMHGHWMQYRGDFFQLFKDCLLYTSPSPRDRTRSRMPSSA